MNTQDNSCIWPTFYKGYITGQVESCVIFDAFPVELVLNLLPEGFQLAAQNASPEGTHPVYWCFNLNQSKVGTPLPLLCLKYHEFAFVIPYVQYGDQTTTMGAYSPALYLNSLMGVLGGRVLFQLPKHYRSCSLSSASFSGEDIMMTVKSNKSSTPILKASFIKDQNPIASTSEAFDHIKSMLDQRLISDGWLGRRSSTFNLFYQDVPIFPLSSTIETGQFLPGLNDTLRRIPPITDDALGGFYFDLNWKLSLPKKL